MCDIVKKETLESIRLFANLYTKRTNTFLCKDLAVTATVLEGLARNKEEVGSALCPCRHYEDKSAEANLSYWTCPCVPMVERKECHCMLFLTSDNSFSSTEQEIGYEKLGDLVEKKI